MKAFLRLGSAFILLSHGTAYGAAAYPTISSPFAELRKAPVFQSEALTLAKTWGVAIPVGTAFQVEKIYGRWVFGKPLPLPHMRSSDYSPSEWIFSRHLE